MVNFILTRDDFTIDYDNQDISFVNNNIEKRFDYIYDLGLSQAKAIRDSATVFLVEIAKIVIKEITLISGIEIKRNHIDFELSTENVKKILKLRPNCIGSQYVDNYWVMRVADGLTNVYCERISRFEGSVDEYFSIYSDNISLPSRIYFHLVESKDNNFPFAFVATYTSKQGGKIKQYPLKFAPLEFKENSNKLSLLTKPLYKLAKRSKLINDLIESGDIFSPIYFTGEEAYSFLKEIDLYQNFNIVCRIPNWWEQRNDGNRIEIDVSQAEKDGFKIMTKDMLVKVSPSMVYNGVKISRREIEELLMKSEGLSQIKGKWVEVDIDKLNSLLEKYDELKSEGMSISNITRMDLYENTGTNVEVVFSKSDWLTQLAKKSFSHDNYSFQIPDTFVGKLRKYQDDGVQWLMSLTELGFGSCLADDMGLGKTVQILAYLECYKLNNTKNVLLIVPSSLVLNWVSEIIKFTPGLNYYVANKMSSSDQRIRNSFLTITTYQIAQNLSSIYDIEWGVVILDEAQAIKNPRTMQSRKVKQISKDIGIAMTGTPIENNLLNLWSIFDFINPGILGNESQFRKSFDLVSSTKENTQGLTEIIKPFMLRRLKTDKKIIDELPDKLEEVVYTSLSKKQIILYQKVVSELNDSKISEENQFTQKRKVLESINHLKQICNHPSQYTGGTDYALDESGKFQLLIDICQLIYEKREKVLVFTQYKQIVQPIYNVLETVFNSKGLIITGDTSMTKRKENVDLFQKSEIPFMVLSLKAAGVGLNLTKATNVIHFDRWWNPAVENQATDRAFRIGQKHNVNVYKLVSKDTIEEVISHLLEVKSDLSNSVLDEIDNNVLKKLSAKELINSVKYTGEVIEDE